jgi:hypothetical protein
MTKENAADEKKCSRTRRRYSYVASSYTPSLSSLPAAKRFTPKCNYTARLTVSLNKRHRASWDSRRTRRNSSPPNRNGPTSCHRLDDREATVSAVLRHLKQYKVPCKPCLLLKLGSLVRAPAVSVGSQISSNDISTASNRSISLGVGNVSLPAASDY